MNPEAPICNRCGRAVDAGGYLLAIHRQGSEGPPPPISPLCLCGQCLMGMLTWLGFDEAEDGLTVPTGPPEPERICSKE
jgi:hypothetical protein